MVEWLDMSVGQVSAMRHRARKCFETRYTAKRAAVSMLANIYQIMATEKVKAEYVGEGRRAKGERGGS
jgi:hypothetical protein